MVASVGPTTIPASAMRSTRALLTRLEAADDERAPACHRALAGRSWDLAAARSAATGSPMADDAGESGRLRRLAQLVVPAETDVLQIADALRLAAAELDAVAGSAAGRARALGELWAVKRQAAGLSSSTLRSQVLCLTAYLDCGTASRAAYLLSALSRACHYHPYELAPTAAELLGWLDETAKIVTRMQEAGAAPASHS